MSAADGFVGCDWGTSNLRLRWVDARRERVVGEVTCAEGVKQAFTRWQTQGGDRTGAFYEILARRLAELERQAGIPLADAPVLVSGMASSSIGVEELPYAGLPFALDGEGLVHRVLERPLPGGQPVVLLSGLRSATDVMRGEETQLVGLGHLLPEAGAPAVLVLPGTHSKHVFVEGGAVRDFQTHMTGELFEVLCAHSILRDSVRASEFSARSGAAFTAGVRAAADAPLTNALFHTRTHALFGTLAPDQNYWYLSGTLIAAELGALSRRPGLRIRLCAGAGLQPLYQAALAALGLGDRTESVPAALVDRSSAWGQLGAYRRLFGAG